MPKRAPQVCQCGAVHPSGEKCPTAKRWERERKARADAKRPSARKRGYDAEWEKLRANHLKVYPNCKRCGEPATVVDHIIPVRQAPHRRLDPSNLQSLCTNHHSSAKQSEERRNTHKE